MWRLTERSHTVGTLELAHFIPVHLLESCKLLKKTPIIIQINNVAACMQHLNMRLLYGFPHVDLFIELHLK